jgi:hypothetical protein
MLSTPNMKNCIFTGCLDVTKFASAATVIPYVLFCSSSRVCCLTKLSVSWPCSVIHRRTDKGNRRTGSKPGPVPLCSPQIPYDLTWSRTRAAVVVGWRLTAWTIARARAILMLPCHPSLYDPCVASIFCSLSDIISLIKSRRWDRQ